MECLKVIYLPMFLPSLVKSPTANYNDFSLSCLWEVPNESSQKVRKLQTCCVDYRVIFPRILHRIKCNTAVF